MAQQINLLTPILLKPRRHFTAAAMVQALALILFGSLVLAAWITSRADQRRTEFQQSLQALQAEQAALNRSLTSLPGATDLKAIEAQIATLKQQQQSQAELLQSLASGHQPAGRRHSDLLGLLADTVPSSVWLQSLRWQSGQLELSGGTLDPAALRSWLAQLQSQPLLHKVALAEVKIEMVNAADHASPGGPSPAGSLQLPTGWPSHSQTVWAFQARGIAPAIQTQPPAGVQP